MGVIAVAADRQRLSRRAPRSDEADRGLGLARLALAQRADVGCGQALRAQRRHRVGGALGGHAEQESAAGLRGAFVGAHHGLIGPQMHTPVDASYLADSVLLLRYFEADGEMRQAISVVKKRSGAHERTIREFLLSSGGLRVGPPLKEFRGVLTGVPTAASGLSQPAG